jgi:inner membrane protein
MCSIITHPAVPIALSAIFPKHTVSPTVLLIGAGCSIVPDLDVIGFIFVIRYEDMMGHRGLTHSIFFAFVLSMALILFLPQSSLRNRLLVLLFLFISTVSHGILDAFTNGGLGVAFFAPFQNERYFFPWRPIVISPIGISNFFSSWGVQVILSEIKWVWLPLAVVFALAQGFKIYKS